MIYILKYNESYNNELQTMWHALLKSYLLSLPLLWPFLILLPFDVFFPFALTFQLSFSCILGFGIAYLFLKQR